MRYISWKICGIFYWSENDSFFQKFPQTLCSSMLLSEVVRWAGASFIKFMKTNQTQQANLKAAPKLTANVLHPGNWKQVFFDPTTCAAIRRYFSEKNHSAEFLNLFYVFWTISNSKETRNTNNLIGSAAIKNYGKPQFLRDLASWIDMWDALKYPNAEKFTLSAQTRSAMKWKLRC